VVCVKEGIAAGRHEIGRNVDVGPQLKRMGRSGRSHWARGGSLEAEWSVPGVMIAGSRTLGGVMFRPGTGCRTWLSRVKPWRRRHIGDIGALLVRLLRLLMVMRVWLLRVL
jgi:hypothetical protein